MLATATVLAQETMRYGDGWHHASPFWPFMPFLWILFWAGLIYFFIRSCRRRHAWHAHRSGEGVLAERFARGEIDEQEYRDRLDTLRRVGSKQRE